MVRSNPQELLRRETLVAYGPAPRGLAGEVLEEQSWQLVGDEFLLRGSGDHFFHYRKGQGIVIERGEGADASVESLWLSGSVYSAVACINGFLPFHASAVCHGGKVYAFTGESGAGKSTLVTALAGPDMPLFCDDTLVLDLSDPDRVLCLPGHKRLKLTPEALDLTGATGEERVGEDIDKFYSRPDAIYAGDPLPLGRLVFLEEGSEERVVEIRGAERVRRLTDDHYTAQHFAAARQFDNAALFAHIARLAGQIAMSRFIRPRDLKQFPHGVEFVRRYIAGAEAQDRDRSEHC